MNDFRKPVFHRDAEFLPQLFGYLSMLGFVALFYVFLYLSLFNQWDLLWPRIVS